MQVNASLVTMTLRRPILFVVSTPIKKSIYLEIVAFIKLHGGNHIGKLERSFLPGGERKSLRDILSFLAHRPSVFLA